MSEHDMTIKIKELEDRIKDMEGKICEHEMHTSSKWNSTYGKYIGMCNKCGLLIAGK
jgi:hypothetical protein